MTAAPKLRRRRLKPRVAWLHQRGRALQWRCTALQGGAGRCREVQGAAAGLCSHHPSLPGHSTSPAVTDRAVCAEPPPVWMDCSHGHRLQQARRSHGHRLACCSHPHQAGGVVRCCSGVQCGSAVQCGVVLQCSAVLCCSEVCSVLQQCRRPLLLPPVCPAVWQLQTPRPLPATSHLPATSLSAPKLLPPISQACLLLTPQLSHNSPLLPPTTARSRQHEVTEGRCPGCALSNVHRHVCPGVRGTGVGWS